MLCLALLAATPTDSKIEKAIGKQHQAESKASLSYWRAMIVSDQAMIEKLTAIRHGASTMQESDTVDQAIGKATSDLKSHRGFVVDGQSVADLIGGIKSTSAT